MAMTFEERQAQQADPLYQLYRQVVPRPSVGMPFGGMGAPMQTPFFPQWMRNEQYRGQDGFANWRTALMNALNATGGVLGRQPQGTPVANTPLTPIWGQQANGGQSAPANPIPAYTPPPRNDIAGALPGFTKQKVNQLQQGQGFAQLLNGG